MFWRAAVARKGRTSSDNGTPALLRLELSSIDRSMTGMNAVSAELDVDLGLHLISIQGWIALRVTAPLGFM